MPACLVTFSAAQLSILGILWWISPKAISQTVGQSKQVNNHVDLVVMVVPESSKNTDGNIGLREDGKGEQVTQLSV